MADRIVFVKEGAPDRDGFDRPEVHELMAARGYKPAPKPKSTRRRRAANTNDLPNDDTSDDTSSSDEQE